jgi:hypothetical protein
MSQGVILYGETTRELYGAWHARVGSIATLPQGRSTDIVLLVSG